MADTRVTFSFNCSNKLSDEQLEMLSGDFEDWVRGQNIDYGTFLGMFDCYTDAATNSNKPPYISGGIKSE